MSYYPSATLSYALSWNAVPVAFLFFFSNWRTVGSVVLYLLTPSSWWRLCSALVHWIEMILTLTAALQAHATVFSPLRKNYHYARMKHKSGFWERERREVLKRLSRWKRGGDNVLLLDQCCSGIAWAGAGWVYLLTIEYVGNGNLKMTDGQAWMKTFVFVHYICPFFSISMGIVWLTFPKRH